jgi:hypothetical protein
MPDSISRLEQLTHEDLVDLITTSFGDITSWTDTD